MANYLQANIKQTIDALAEKGWSRRRITGELGIDRRTVGLKCIRWDMGRMGIEKVLFCTVVTL